VTNEFKGFSLFNDIEDVSLRNRNRAVVLANIADDNNRNNMISAKGGALILGYFQSLPEEDRADVRDKFAQQMRERGYVVNGN